MSNYPTESSIKLTTTKKKIIHSLLISNSELLFIGFARLYTCGVNYPKWLYSDLEGALALTIDQKGKCGRFILYDLSTYEVLFETELYKRFNGNFQKQTDNFFCFEVNKGFIGFDLPDANDGNELWSQITQQNDAVVTKRAREYKPLTDLDLKEKGEALLLNLRKKLSEDCYIKPHEKVAMLEITAKETGREFETIEYDAEGGIFYLPGNGNETETLIKKLKGIKIQEKNKAMIAQTNEYSKSIATNIINTLKRVGLECSQIQKQKNEIIESKKASVPNIQPKNGEGARASVQLKTSAQDVVKGDKPKGNPNEPIRTIHKAQTMQTTSTNVGIKPIENKTKQPSATSAKQPVAKQPQAKAEEASSIPVPPQAQSQPVKANAQIPAVPGVPEPPQMAKTPTAGQGGIPLPPPLNLTMPVIPVVPQSKAETVKAKPLDLQAELEMKKNKLTKVDIKEPVSSALKKDSEKSEGSSSGGNSMQNELMARMKNKGKPNVETKLTPSTANKTEPPHAKPIKTEQPKFTSPTVPQIVPEPPQMAKAPTAGQGGIPLPPPVSPLNLTIPVIPVVPQTKAEPVKAGPIDLQAELEMKKNKLTKVDIKEPVSSALKKDSEKTESSSSGGGNSMQNELMTRLKNRGNFNFEGKTKPNTVNKTEPEKTKPIPPTIAKSQTNTVKPEPPKVFQPQPTKVSSTVPQGVPSVSEPPQMAQAPTAGQGGIPLPPPVSPLNLTMPVIPVVAQSKAETVKAKPFDLQAELELKKNKLTKVDIKEPVSSALKKDSDKTESSSSGGSNSMQNELMARLKNRGNFNFDNAGKNKPVESPTAKTKQPTQTKPVQPTPLQAKPLQPQVTEPSKVSSTVSQGVPSVPEPPQMAKTPTPGQGGIPLPPPVSPLNLTIPVIPVVAQSKAETAKAKPFDLQAELEMKKNKLTKVDIKEPVSSALKKDSEKTESASSGGSNSMQNELMARLKNRGNFNFDNAGKPKTESNAFVPPIFKKAEPTPIKTTPPKVETPTQVEPPKTTSSGGIPIPPPMAFPITAPVTNKPTPSTKSKPASNSKPSGLTMAEELAKGIKLKKVMTEEKFGLDYNKKQESQTANATNAQSTSSSSSNQSSGNPFLSMMKGIQLKKVPKP